MIRHTFKICIIELILGVDDDEHALVEDPEEGVHDVGEFRLAFVVVVFQFTEEIGEHVRVLEVNDAVGFLEHVVEFSFGFVHHVSEEI